MSHNVDAKGIECVATSDIATNISLVGHDGTNVARHNPRKICSRSIVAQTSQNFIQVELWNVVNSQGIIFLEIGYPSVGGKSQMMANLLFYFYLDYFPYRRKNKMT